jgi:hypothetical protein
MPGSIQLSGDVAVGDLVDGRSDPNADGATADGIHR